MSYSYNFVQLFSSVMKLCIFFVIIIVNGVSYSLHPHLVNFDKAKNALRTALELPPAIGPLSIITITRTPVNPGSTELISHDEFRELLGILYPLCSGSDAPMYSKFVDFGRYRFLSAIPGFDHVRDFWWRATGHQEVILNDIAVSAQEICDVGDMCQNLKRFHNRYLKNSCNVLVFNEMSFSQVEPLTVTQKDFINSKFFEMSRVAPYTFFYPNYLYTETRRKSGHAIYNIYRHMKRASRCHNDLMDIGGDRGIITDCGDILRANVQDDNNFYNQLFLVNETYYITVI